MLAFIDGRRAHHRSICANPKSQESANFVSAFACVAKHRAKQARELEVASIRQMDAIVSEQVSDFKERFQRACCIILDYRRRSAALMEPHCAQAAQLSALDGVIDSTVGPAVEFACPDSKLGVCQSFAPLKLNTGPVTKSLTRAGTDLLMALTSPDDESEKKDASSRNRT